jgi:hypothetical protein
VEPLATIDFFNLDDTPFAPAYRVDGMHAKPAIGNKPRNHLLSHSDPPPPKEAGA